MPKYESGLALDTERHIDPHIPEFFKKATPANVLLSYAILDGNCAEDVKASRYGGECTVLEAGGGNGRSEGALMETSDDNLIAATLYISLVAVYTNCSMCCDC